jgi:hypothetical protein
MKARFGEVHQLFAPSPNGWYWRSAADHGWIVIRQELVFRLSGAEICSRNAGRIGGFEEGEFEADGATKEVATQIFLSRPDAAGQSSRAARLSATSQDLSQRMRRGERDQVK